MSNGRLNKPTPKTQRELSVEQHVSTYVPAGNPNYADPNVPGVNRALQTSFRNDNTKPFSIGIKDIDEAVYYYFENIIQPSVIQNGARLPVPIIYGSPEKWKSFQKDGYYRDQKGRIMAPLIMFKRESIDKVRSVSNKLDANNPHNYSVSTKRYDANNSYDNFKVLTNRIPEKQFYATVIPDYITVNYTCAVFTYYVEQLNKIVEAIEYASDAYWGDPQRFKFRSMIDSFGFQTELVQDEERIVKSTFNIKLNGYIVPEILQKDINSIKKYTETTKIIFSVEASSVDALYNGQINNNGTITTPETIKALEVKKKVNAI